MDRVISSADVISLSAVLVCFFVLLRGWRKESLRTARFPLAALLLAVLFNNLSNSLEWTHVTGLLDVPEDYAGLLNPVLWLFVLHAFLQEEGRRVLRESDERFRQLGDHLSVVFWLSDRTMRHMVYVSSAYERICGVKWKDTSDCPEPLIGTVHPDDLQRVLTVTEDRVKGEPTEVQFRIIRPDGAERWISSRTFPVLGNAGEPYRIAGIAEDITLRIETEQRLREDQSQLQSLASELAVAEERERRRLARFLHDQVGQLLVTSKIKLGTLKKTTSDDRVEQVLSDVCTALDQAIRDTRTLTFDLSSPILQELGLEAAVAEWLSEEIEGKHGITAEFEDYGRLASLDDDFAAIIFRDVRELLINVVKHAKAETVKVSMEKTEEHIRVVVKDDGIGFNPDEAASMISDKATFGLFSIRQRLEQVGGSLEIRSAPGAGCTVVMTTPLGGSSLATGGNK